MYILRMPILIGVVFEKFVISILSLQIIFPWDGLSKPHKISTNVVLPDPEEPLIPI